jgi:hypothetical protein
MTRSTEDILTRALCKIIGGRLIQSGLGAVWRDDATWRGFAKELVASLHGLVVVDRATYDALVRDSRQMAEIRRRANQYHATDPKRVVAKWKQVR